MTSPIDVLTEEAVTEHERPYWEYVLAPVPHARDERIAAALTSLLAADPALRDEAADRLGPEHTATLLRFAERAAARAVRGSDPAPLYEGLAVIALVWRGCEDPTDALPVLGVLCDAAARVAGRPHDVFATAARMAPPDVAPLFSDFLRRRDLTDIAAVMGYYDAQDENGFRYHRIW